MSLMLADRYMKLAETPISAGDFYGADVRYSAEFERIENELSKASSLHAQQTPDWSLVHDGCEALLLSQSKDLRAAVWLAWSLYQVESVPGLEAGLTALNALCAQHWEALHPRKPRTRLAALTWLTSRIDQAMADLPTAAPDTLKRLASQLRKLDECLAGHFADQAPLLLPICRRLDALVSSPQSQHQAVEDATRSALAAVPSAQVIPINPNSSDTLSAINDSRDAHKCLRIIQDQARLLSHWWSQESVTDPRAYRLTRTLLWLPIDTLPEHDADKNTTLRGLPVDRLASYRERLAQGQFNALLIDLEGSLTRSPFWLDGQYMAWQCLQALDAQPAMHEIEVQLALFLQRLPGLQLLCFHDHSAFADEQTRAWIESRVQPHTATANQRVEYAAEASPQRAQSPWEDALDAAVQQLRKGSLKAGIQLIKQAMPALRSDRERFHWQLAQARLCYQARQYELAYHQLESLYQVLKDVHLDRWEPDLALTLLRLLLDCCNKLPGSSALRERKSEIYQRLCQLDLEAALDQASGPSQ